MIRIKRLKTLGDHPPEGIVVKIYGLPTRTAGPFDTTAGEVVKEVELAGRRADGADAFKGVAMGRAVDEVGPVNELVGGGACRIAPHVNMRFRANDPPLAAPHNHLDGGPRRL